MLNWRRDPDYERRMNALAIRIQQTRNETEQIKSETRRLRQETEWLKQQNSKGRQLLASIDALCFPPDSNWSQAIETDLDSKPSSP